MRSQWDSLYLGQQCVWLAWHWSNWEPDLTSSGTDNRIDPLNFPSPTTTFIGKKED